MGLRIAEIDHTPRPCTSLEPAKATYGLRNALLIGRNDFAQVFRVHAGDIAIEPTKSENITVTWRRSAVSWGFGSTPPAGLCFDAYAPGSSAIAASILRRCPSETPIFSRSASVKWRSTETSISFSANRCACCPRLLFQPVCNLLHRRLHGYWPPSITPVLPAAPLPPSDRACRTPQ